MVPSCYSRSSGLCCALNPTGNSDGTNIQNLVHLSKSNEWKSFQVRAIAGSPQRQMEHLRVGITGVWSSRRKSLTCKVRKLKVSRQEMLKEPSVANVSSFRLSPLKGRCNNQYCPWQLSDKKLCNGLTKLHQILASMQPDPQPALTWADCLNETELLTTHKKNSSRARALQCPPNSASSHWNVFVKSASYYHTSAKNSLMKKTVFSKCKHWYFAAHSACYMLLKDWKLFSLPLPLVLFPLPTANISKKYTKDLEDHLQSLWDLKLEVHAPGRWSGCKAAGCKVKTPYFKNFSKRISHSRKTLKSSIGGQEIYQVLSVQSRRALWLGVIPLSQGGPRRINPANCTAHTVSCHIPTTTPHKGTGLQYMPPQRPGKQFQCAEAPVVWCPAALTTQKWQDLNKSSLSSLTLPWIYKHLKHWTPTAHVEENF